MRIYLVRHGDAIPEEQAGSDRDRWLSPHGREAVRVLGRLLRENSVVPDMILSSPLPRAVQTAELLAGSLDYLGTVVSLRGLEPAAQPQAAAPAIRSAGAAVLVISHEPVISAIGAFVLGLPAFPQFRTAQCCAIENGKPTFTARADLAQVLPLFVD
ncbi:MAG TPA: phosphoglycerate mutase family protein [Kofleriaceae bacterium]|nr:phosphoglycerate mutase family protein [Kofleriaceae bacterium]